MESFLEILRKEMDELPRDAKLAIASSPLVSIEVLRALAKDSDYYVRAAVAANPKILEDDLRALAEDKGALVRAAVASNPRTPEETRIKLLEDENGSVRLAAVANLKTSDRLSNFASAEDVWLRVGAARNSLLPDGERRKLLEDKDPWVRENAAAHLKEDPEFFRSLARQRDWAIRCGLASNKNLTDQETAEILAEDKDCNIRRYLACSGSDGANHVRMKLALDKEESVRMAACEHLAYKAEEVRKIVAREKDASARENQADGAPERIASNPSISEELEQDLAGSASVETLIRLLANPSQSQTVFREVLSNSHLREGLVNSEDDFSERITRFFFSIHTLIWSWRPLSL